MIVTREEALRARAGARVISWPAREDAPAVARIINAAYNAGEAGIWQPAGRG